MLFWTCRTVMYCRCTAGVLQYCRCTAGVLQVYCRCTVCTAGVLYVLQVLQVYCSTAGVLYVLQVYCRCTVCTAGVLYVLQVYCRYCRCTAGVLLCTAGVLQVYRYVLQVIKSLNPHKDFRLWMTAEVHPKFPTILLQSSLKITFEVCLARFFHLIHNCILSFM